MMVMTWKDRRDRRRARRIEDQRIALFSSAEARWRGEIERLNQCIRWEQHRASRIGTHATDCHHWGPQHYECLLGKYERLHEALQRIALLDTPQSIPQRGVVGNIARTALGEDEQ